MQALKRKRLEIIQKQRTTAATKGGLFAIDDTGCPWPFAMKTEGAKWQYCGPLKREEVCNVGVDIAFVSQAKLKDCDIPLKFVEVLGKWNKDDQNTYHILIINQFIA
ncbi:MAG: hypothetical protein E3K36_11565 [Candidatus Brocadia sp.]|nr:hypothetical protein [Candidatus Brocadia sp.]